MPNVGSVGGGAVLKVRNVFLKFHHVRHQDTFAKCEASFFLRFLDGTKSVPARAQKTESIAAEHGFELTHITDGNFVFFVPQKKGFRYELPFLWRWVDWVISKKKECGINGENEPAQVPFGS